MLNSRDVKQRARELGFTHTGIARAELLEEEGRLLDEWFRRDYDATMGWMRKRREERRDIRQILRFAPALDLAYVERHVAALGLVALWTEVSRDS